MFEIGVTTQIAHEDRYGNREEMERHLKHMATQRLADEILSKDLYMRKITADRRDPFVFPCTEHTYTILIGGVVDAVGPGTREGAIAELKPRDKNRE